MSIPRNGITHAPAVWTRDRVTALGPTTDVETAGQILGIGRTLAYSLAKADDFPVPVLRLGNLYRIPTQGLIDALFTTRSGQEAS